MACRQRNYEIKAFAQDPIALEEENRFCQKYYAGYSKYENILNN
jgi:hypothetical protein